MNEAMEMTGRQEILYPEFALTKGDLVLALPNASGAERWFQDAFDLAAQLGARTAQLRAATRLTRLWRGAGKRPDGIDVLRGVYETFTEGLDTRDLVEARAVLDQVDAPVL